MHEIHAAAHPGKIGDCLYVLPLLRYLSKRDDVIFDFYTSSYCAPLKELFEYQDCIHSFYIASDYVLQDFGCGAQPWQVPVPNTYNKVYQLGFRRYPDQMLHQFIASEQDVNVPLAIEYQCPDYDTTEEYICIAPRGNTRYNYLFDKLPQHFNCRVVGGAGDYRGHGQDFTGLSFLKTCSILAKAKAFVGLMSSQLVLANGFPIPRIAPHDGVSWHLHHCVQYYLNHYPINPSIEEVIRLCR